MKRCNNCFEQYDDNYEICPHCGYYKGKPPMELNHLYPGTVLAQRYIVGEVLGFGGFGITYKAWDQKHEVVVAIKEYFPSKLANRVPGEKEVMLFAKNHAGEFHAGLQRFLDEARNTVKFNSHKNIVNVYEYFEENSTAYIVEEFLDGVQLGEFVKTNRIGQEDCISLIQDVCAALHTIHQHHVIHRDVSPENIMLCCDGTVKLIDFGEARFVETEDTNFTVVLKPGFAPPEQYDKISQQGPWTDVYAVGATLYYILTGVKPLESTNRKVGEKIKTPHEIDPEIDENLSNAVMKAMAVERHMRYQTIEEFSKVIEKKQKVLTLAEEKHRRKVKRMLGICSGMAAVAMLAAVVGVWLWKAREAVVLPAAELAVYYEQSGVEERDLKKQTALQTIADSFMNSYPDVKLEVIGLSGEHYQQELTDLLQGSAEEGKIPGIFESSAIAQDSLMEIAGDISQIMVQDQTNTDELLQQYHSEEPQSRQIPLGFSIPVVYYNKTLTDFQNREITELEDIFLHAEASAAIAFSDEYQSFVKSVFGKTATDRFGVIPTEDAEGYLTGQYPFYLASSEQYAEIQHALPGQYGIARIAAEVSGVQWRDFYSINGNMTKDDTKVASAFLSYLLADNSQDCFYIQNWAGKFPINSQVLALTEEVYDDFEGFFGTDASNEIPE